MRLMLLLLMKLLSVILRVVENVLEADFSSDDVNDDSVEQIISNTEETWQKDSRSDGSLCQEEQRQV